MSAMKSETKSTSIFPAWSEKIEIFPLYVSAAAVSEKSNFFHSFVIPLIFVDAAFAPDSSAPICTVTLETLPSLLRR